MPTFQIHTNVPQEVGAALRERCTKERTPLAHLVSDLLCDGLRMARVPRPVPGRPLGAVGRVKAKGPKAVRRVHECKSARAVRS